MKWFIYNITVIVVVMFAFSCEEKECCVGPDDDANSVFGEWQLYERGYSPGAGYFIEPVSPVPPQRIMFKGNGELSCTVKELAHFKFYAIEGDVIGLFTTRPHSQLDVAEFTHSYNIRFEDGNLKLYFRYCFEGCHLGFREVE